MARFATLCEIAGVSVTGCRVEVDPSTAPVLNSRSGSVDWANDHKPHVQVFNAGALGKFVVLNFASQDIDNHLGPLLDAVDAAEATASTFTLRVVDGLYDIDVQAGRDFTQQWMTHGKHSEGWYETIVMRFLIHGIN
jgi:hypothetical protein